MTKYLVRVFDSNNIGYSCTFKETFDSSEDAENKLNDIVKNRLTWEEYEYTEDDIRKMKQRSTPRYFEDIEGEWYAEILPLDEEE